MKKILSFFLVLCMLITAVPALLIPVLAEEGEGAADKIFSYADAYPNFTKTISETKYQEAGYADDAAYKAWLELPETFAVNQGDYGWLAGEYDVATGALAPFDRVAFYATDTANGHDVSWITTDAYYKAALDKYIETANANGGLGGGVDASNIWTGAALMGQAKFNGFTHTNAAKAIGIQYTVAEEGFYLPMIAEDIVDGSTGGHKLAVLVNGNIVWPLAASAADYNSWYTIAAGATTAADAVNLAISVAFESIELYAGDKVTFAIQGGHLPVTVVPALKQIPAPEPVKFSFIEEFSVTYSISEFYKMKGAYDPANGKGLDTSDDAFASVEDYLAFLLAEDTFKVDQGNSNWKVGEYKLDGTFTPYSRVMFMAGDQGGVGKHDINWVSTEEAYVARATRYANGEAASIWDGAPLWHLHPGAEWQANQGLIESGVLKPGGITTSGNGFISAIQYTVAEAGTYGVSFTRFEHLLESMHKIAILVNGQPVWPVTATADKTDGWFNISSSSTTLESILAELEPVSFEASAGDIVSFCVAGAGNAVFMEPVMVQKPAGAIYLVLSDPFGSMTQSIKVRPGATVTLPTYTSDLIFIGWDANGDGVADYRDGAEVTMGEETMTLSAVTVAPSKFADNLPTWDAKTESVQFHGGWTMGVWEKESMNFLPLAYDSSGIFLTPVSGGPWGTTGGGIYYTSRTGLIVITGTVLEGESAGSYISTIQKTADYSGKAELDFDQLMIGRELSANVSSSENPVSGGMAIYVGGEKVWPADEDYFWFTSPDLYPAGYNINYDFRKVMIEDGSWPFPLSLDVKMGDTIDIRTVQGNPDNWMFYYKPTVSFTEVSETPMVSHTSVDIAKDFTLNVYANVLAKAEGTTVAMEYWTAEPTAEQLAAGGTDMGAAVEENGLYKFAYAGLTAKQMSDVIYVRPYTVNEAGDKNYGKVVPVSIKAYAMAAMGQSEALDNLLVAMLNYGANTQALFGYNVDAPANADLTEEQKRATADIAAMTDVYNNEDGANKIKNVSLIMGTDIGMKYMIDSVEGATTYELEVSKNADFSDSTKIAMEAVWEGKEQKAIYNISFAELGDTFYVRAVVDGEAGATLTYSVNSYALRISASCSDGLYFSIMSLAHLGQMLEAYTA